MDITLHDVCYGYGPHRVLDGISFSLETPEIFCILGANGAGKSTLLACMAGQQAVQSGQIAYDGQDVTAYSAAGLARKIAYIPQSHTPTFPFSVRDIVMMGRAASLGPFSSPGRAERRLADEKLELLGIAYLADQAYTEISGGERQLVLLAAALAQESQLLLLDEPTAHLDFGRQFRFLQMLQRLQHMGIGIVMTTHFPDQALHVADRTAILAEGKIQAIGSPEDVITAENLTCLYHIPIAIYDVPDAHKKICLPAEPQC